VTCNSNFTLNSNNYCQYSDPNCVLPAATKCNQCAFGYFITSSGMCIQLKNCTVINLLNNSCSQCDSGYTLSQGTCVQILITVTLNCQNYNSLTGKCIACSLGYSLINSICVSTLCKTYSAVNGVCLSCYTGYILINSTCIAAQQLDPYCETFNVNGKCS
jgi:hypothetical protein